MTTIETKRVRGRQMSRRSFTLMAALTLGAGAIGMTGVATAEDKKVEETLKALQGNWVSTENSGFDSSWAFSGDDLKSSVNGNEYVCKVSADPSAKPHATVDLVIKDGPEGAKGQTSKAIYKLDGEKLILCVALPGRNRPNDFEQVDDEAYLFELKKEKKG